MSSIVEILVILTIVCFQVWIAGKTYNQIQKMKEFYNPEVDSLLLKYGTVSSPKTETSTKAPRTFYLFKPCEENKFKDDKISQDQGYYTFTELPGNNHRATFEFTPGTKAIKAYYTEDVFITPVCKLEGKSLAIVQSCRTITPGEAELRDGYWIVTKKAVVVYE